MIYTASVAAHMVANKRKKRGGQMIKIRIQGTVDDIMWLEQQINSLDKVKVTESSALYSNQGTKKYFRKYMEVEPVRTGKRA